MQQSTSNANADKKRKKGESSQTKNKKQKQEEPLVPVRIIELTRAVEYKPFSQPYIPQLRDRVVYLRQGHAAYSETFNKDMLPPPFVLYPQLPAEVDGVLEDIEYKLYQPDKSKWPLTLCRLTLLINEPTRISFDLPETITFDYVEEVFPDFIVQQDRFNAGKALYKRLEIGSAATVLFDGEPWTGRVQKLHPKEPQYPDSIFECVEIAWESGDPTLVSAYELQEITQERCYTIPSIEPSVEKALVSRISKLKIWDLPLPSDTTPYPILLAVVTARLEHHFYRNIHAAFSDLKHIVEVVVGHNVVGEKQRSAASELAKNVILWREFAYAELGEVPLPRTAISIPQSIQTKSPDASKTKARTKAKTRTSGSPAELKVRLKVGNTETSPTAKSTANKDETTPARGLKSKTTPKKAGVSESSISGRDSPSLRANKERAKIEQTVKPQSVSPQPHQQITIQNLDEDEELDNDILANIVAKTPKRAPKSSPSPRSRSIKKDLELSQSGYHSAKLVTAANESASGEKVSRLISDFLGGSVEQQSLPNIPKIAKRISKERTSSTTTTIRTTPNRNDVMPLSPASTRSSQLSSREHESVSPQQKNKRRFTEFRNDRDGQQKARSRSRSHSPSPPRHRPRSPRVHVVSKPATKSTKDLQYSAASPQSTQGIIAAEGIQDFPKDDDALSIAPAPASGAPASAPPASTPAPASASAPPAPAPAPAPASAPAPISGPTSKLTTTPNNVPPFPAVTTVREKAPTKTTVNIVRRGTDGTSVVSSKVIDHAPPMKVAKVVAVDTLQPPTTTPIPNLSSVSAPEVPVEQLSGLATSIHPTATPIDNAPMEKPSPQPLAEDTSVNTSGYDTLPLYHDTITTVAAQSISKKVKKSKSRSKQDLTDLEYDQHQQQQLHGGQHHYTAYEDYMADLVREFSVVQSEQLSVPCSTEVMPETNTEAQDQSDGQRPMLSFSIPQAVTSTRRRSQRHAATAEYADTTKADEVVINDEQLKSWQSLASKFIAEQSTAIRPVKALNSPQSSHSIIDSEVPNLELQLQRCLFSKVFTVPIPTIETTSNIDKLFKPIQPKFANQDVLAVSSAYYPLQTNTTYPFHLYHHGVPVYPSAAEKNLMRRARHACCSVPLVYFSVFLCSMETDTKQYGGHGELSQPSEAMDIDLNSSTIPSKSDRQPTTTTSKQRAKELQQLPINITISTELTKTEVLDLFTLWRRVATMLRAAHDSQQLFKHPQVAMLREVHTQLSFLIEEGFVWHDEGFYLKINQGIRFRNTTCSLVRGVGVRGSVTVSLGAHKFLF